MLLVLRLTGDLALLRASQGEPYGNASRQRPGREWTGPREALLPGAVCA